MATVVKCTVADALVTHPIRACGACDETACAFHPAKTMGEEEDRPPITVEAHGPVELFQRVAETLIDAGMEPGGVVAAMGIAATCTLLSRVPPTAWDEGVETMCTCIRAHVAATAADVAARAEKAH